MTHLLPGDPAPWFVAATSSNPQYNFSTVAGRYVVLTLFRSSTDPGPARLLAQLVRRSGIFDDARLVFFGISHDAEDVRRLEPAPPAMRYFWDTDGAVARLYGATDIEDRARLTTLLLDVNLRVLAVIAEPDGDRHAETLIQMLGRLPAIPEPFRAAMQAPVLIVPYVFEPGFCRMLIDLYRTNGGVDSGFMREEQGRTVGIVDHRHKRRRDYTIADEKVRLATQQRIKRRLVPEIRKAFQFEATRMERYIVACYDAEEGGYFRPHRDNTTRGTAHRRFAVTLNLNAEEYEGGDLMFPEYGPQFYRAPTGGAVVFSCSMLHEAMPVTKGTRYVFLPFLYDEAAAALRESNNEYLDEKIGGYRR